MRHVDEATLHEYLDETERRSGDDKAAVSDERERIAQHLESCADCGALLEEVKRIRDQASGILAASGPVDLEMPSFDEIRARSEARKRPQRVRQYVRMKQLAWAATVVLAVAVGWYARDTLSPNEAGRLARQSAPASGVAATESEREAGQPAADEARPTVVAQVEQPDKTLGTTGGRGGAIQEQAPVKGEDVQNLAAAPPAALEERGATEGRRDAPTRFAAEPAVPAGAMAPAPGAGPALDSAARGGAAGGIVADSMERERFAEERSQQRVVARRVAAENVAGRERLAVPEEAEYRAANEWSLAVTRWTLTDSAGAADMLGQHAPVITGLDVIDYAVARQAGMVAVRVRHHLDTGEIVELIATPAAGPAVMADVGVAPQEPSVRKQAEEQHAAVNVVTTQIDDLRVAVRGAVDAGVLRGLLARVRGGR